MNFLLEVFTMNINAHLSNNLCDFHVDESNNIMACVIGFQFGMKSEIRGCVYRRVTWRYENLNKKVLP